MAGRLYFMTGFRWKLLLTCALVCVTTLSGVFFHLDRRQESLYLTSMQKQARALFRQVVVTRKWISDHGGVFVAKLPWESPNPYLSEKTVTGTTGRKYIKKNPAMVTRELSEYARREGAYWFHITSLKPINPANAPDDFERSALEGFKDIGPGEIWGVHDIDGHKYFRYMAPLFVETSCLDCHSRQGYRINDVRGGISVAIPMEAYYKAVKKDRALMAIFILVVALVLMAGLYIALDKVLVAPIRELRGFALKWREDTPAADAQLRPQPQCPVNLRISPGDELYDLYAELCSLHGAVTSHQGDLKSKIQDATDELTRINEQLQIARDGYRQASIIKSEFITGISHELRTPLTSIKGAVGYISEKLRDPALMGHDALKDISPFIEIINRNINRFVRLVEDTLDLEKVESGHMQMHIAEVDMESLLKEAQQELILRASERGVDITVSCGSGLLAAADPDRIRQVLANLILNALRHCPEGSVITLDGRAHGDEVIISVGDEGPGIPPAQQEKIFQRFYKGHTGGTGLGLTISRVIVEGHGGRIWVESDGKRGTVFYFSIPVAGAGKEDSAQESGVEAP